MALELSIVTPEEAAVSVSCDEVIVPGVKGEIGLLPGHVPVITALHPGVLTVVNDGKKSFYAVGTGYAELEGEKVTVLTAACVASAAVDVEAAKKQRDEAEKALAGSAESDDDHSVLLNRLQRAQAKLDAASMK